MVNDSRSGSQANDLTTALEAVQEALILHARLDPETTGFEAPESQLAAIPPAERTEEIPSRLEKLCRLFDLGPFERDILVLCAGIELDASFALLCAKAQVDPQRTYPTFGLALAALPGAYWQALLPEAPLRHWQFVRLRADASLTTGELRIDERILHFLVGFDSRDPRLAGLLAPVAADAELVLSHRQLAERIAQTWQHTEGTVDSPVVELCGTDVATRRAVAAASAKASGRQLEVMAVEALPTQVDELDQILRLWHREALMAESVLLLEAGELRPEDPRNGALSRFIDGSRSALIVARRRRQAPYRRPVLSLDVDKPDTEEQRILWRQVAAEHATVRDDPRIDTLVNQFHLSASEIRSTWFEALGRMNPADEATPERIIRSVSLTCRERARPRLADLAERIQPRSKWEDLALPAPQLETLDDIVARMHHRTKVYRDWGFADKSARGLGMSALFSGSSGTGKTMAAEVLADRLDLDLFRIDLSSVVDKYIGETEKNLQRLFEAAESGGAILLFDEADALFGKRSDVKDSHDRHANIEVSYLLQRVETYNGLAILTTNLVQAIDPAFKRRMQFLVEFPYPGFEERLRIWQRVFPEETPTEGIDPERLARVNLSGGNIRSIAMNAAFLAAEAGHPITMRDLLTATRREFTKVNRQLSEAETRDWLY